MSRPRHEGVDQSAIMHRAGIVRYAANRQDPHAKAQKLTAKAQRAQRQKKQKVKGEGKRQKILLFSGFFLRALGVFAVKFNLLHRELG